MPEKNITRFPEAFDMVILVELDDPFLVRFVAFEPFDAEEEVVDGPMGPGPYREGTTMRGDVLDQADHSQAGRKEGFVGRGVQVAIRSGK